MSLFLNEKTLKNKFTELHQEAELLEKAGNLTVEQTDLMIRLLSSKKPEDIQDIPTEQVISCFQYIPEFSQIMNYRSVFDGNFSVKLEKLPVGLKTRRRII